MKILTVILAIIIVGQTNASVQLLEPSQNECPKLIIKNNISIRNLFPKQVTVIEHNNEIVYYREFCGRFYDSYLCKYYDENKNKILIDTFCLNSQHGEHNCLSYLGCNYKIPGKILNNYK